MQISFESRPGHSRNDDRRSGLSRVDVAYTDGTVLTYLFPRSTRIVDLVSMIARAGRVRKVVL